MNFFALLLVGVFAITAFSLFSLALDSEAEVWGHLSSTVLPVYLGNSLILLLGCWNGDNGFRSSKRFPDGTL